MLYLDDHSPVIGNKYDNARIEEDLVLLPLGAMVALLLLYEEVPVRWLREELRPYIQLYYDCYMIIMWLLCDYYMLSVTIQDSDTNWLNEKSENLVLKSQYFNFTIYKL